MTVMLLSDAVKAPRRKHEASGDAMIVRSLVATVLVVCSAMAQATNRGYWDLWALDVAMICFAQDSAYRATPLGNMVLNSYGFPGWDEFDKQPSMACLRSRQWVSDRLCTDVTKLDETTFRNLDSLRRKHENELQGLIDVVVYRYKSREPNNSSLPCPAAK
jgi:hypothetical protein